MKRKEAGKEIRREKEREKGMRRVFLLVMELMALAVLIIAAFFAPQVVFQIQDYFLCANTSLSKRETMDVETLSTTYERSLKQRIQNYVEGLDGGENYYVAEQAFEIDQDVYDFVADILYYDIVLNYVDMGIIPVEFYYYEPEYTVTQWKRYVIYSDDYAKGVSFILWYIEVQDRSGVVMKLLADGEDGTLYALKTETNGLLDQNGTYSNSQTYNLSADIISDAMWFFYDQGSLVALWGFYAVYYEAISREDRDSYIKEFLEQEERGKGQNESVYWDREVYEYDGDGIVVRFHLPYEDIFVEYLVDIGSIDMGLKYVTYRYPDLIMGICQIYEKIPEFA